MQKGGECSPFFMYMFMVMAKMSLLGCHLFSKSAVGIMTNQAFLTEAPVSQADYL